VSLIRQTHEFEQLHGIGFTLSFNSLVSGGLEKQGNWSKRTMLELCNDHVFQSGHFSKKSDILEGPGNSQMTNRVRFQPQYITTFQPYAAHLGSVNPAQAIEKRGLARSIRSDDAHNLAGIDTKIHMINGTQSAKRLGQILDAKKGRITV
jgi:hypothetical protein